MTLTLKNKDTLNLHNIRGVEVRKQLDFTERGRMFVSGWHVIAHMADGGRKLLAERDAGKQKEAIALCSMINHMTIFTTEN